MHLAVVLTFYDGDCKDEVKLTARTIATVSNQFSTESICMVFASSRNSLPVANLLCDKLFVFNCNFDQKMHDIEKRQNLCCKKKINSVITCVLFVHDRATRNLAERLANIHRHLNMHVILIYNAINSPPRITPSIREQEPDYVFSPTVEPHMFIQSVSSYSWLIKHIFEEPQIARAVIESLKDDNSVRVIKNSQCSINSHEVQIEVQIERLQLLASPRIKVSKAMLDFIRVCSHEQSAE